ncbi:MAG: histidine phosphatase family protein [Actinomycetota bacterium]|nr:histidine phosphatase family protein [Actinomycetota bacterium]
MKRLVIVRHGETEWSATGRHTGRTDIALTPAGEAAARGLGRSLVELGVAPTMCLSSPRARAVDTARLAGLGDDLVTDDRLAELDYGEYEGLTTAEIRADRPTWDLFRDGCPGGETIEAAGRRADDLLVSLAPEKGIGDVALVGHGHFSRILAVRYLELQAAQARHFALGTASLSLLGHEHEWRCMLVWNDEVHAPPG